MNISKTFTIETRFNQRYNSDIINYFKEYNILYGKMIRFTWHRIKNGGHFPMTKSKFNTFLQNTFSVSKRIANSVITEVTGIYNALYELKCTEFFQLEIKIKEKNKKYETLKENVNKLKEQAEANTLSKEQLQKYRKMKADLFYIKQKIDRMNRKLKNLRKIIDSRKLSICFGSKKLFLAQYHLKENNFTSHKVWYETFCKHRDNRSFFIGSKDETCGNQLLQLFPTFKSDKGICFNLQLRKNTETKEYLDGVCNFKYMGDQLEKQIIDHQHGISYRIKFRGKKCYLQAMIEFYRNPKDCKTTSTNGVIGLDYNDGFIEMAETNKTGNLINLNHFDLEYHGTGLKAKNEIRETVSRIVNYAISVNKDITIEDLDFKKAKSRIQKAKSNAGKKYNKMIHLFDYSRYKSTFENCCHRRNVNLKMVDPAYTSKVAKQKYCNRMKITVHQGASFVIARKGQGFKDKYIRPKKK